MATGRFIDFTMVYADGRPDGLDNDQQAQKIVDTARGLIGEGAPGVAITYSANQGQTKALVRAYAAGDYAAGISGANQAQVMPNILVIWGDDIGQSNISAYTMGLMGYRTPNIDRIAAKA
jgi:hypothetical protein